MDIVFKDSPCGQTNSSALKKTCFFGQTLSHTAKIVSSALLLSNRFTLISHIAPHAFRGPLKDPVKKLSLFLPAATATQI